MMDVRSVGLGMAGAGAVAQVSGFMLDAAAHSNDATLATREGVFSFSNAGHLLAYLGVMLVLVGVAVAILGPRLYRPGGDHRPGLRAAQFFAPLAAVLLVLSGGYVANASSLGTGHSHDGTSETAAGAEHVPGSHDNPGGGEHNDDHGSSGSSGSAGSSDHNDDHSTSDGTDSSSEHNDDHGSSDSSDGSSDHNDDHGATGTLASTGHAHGGSSDHNDDHGSSGSSGSSDHNDDHGSSGATDHNTDHNTDHGSSGHAHDPGTGGTTDHSHDPGTPGGGHSHCGEAHSHGPATIEPLTDAQQVQLDAQLQTARSYALRFPTAADAMAAGYHQVTHYYCGIGAHYLKWDWLDENFDPAKPEILLYDGDGPKAKLVGVNYYVRKSGGVQPDGFVGPNDHWHQHIGLCLKVFFVIGPESWTEAECKAAGGYKQPNSDSLWLLHAWVVPGYEHPTNVFAGSIPSLPPGPWDVQGITF